MVSKKEITAQLKKIGFNHKGWGRAEISELPNIILPGEEIYECVNGIYEGGFALVVATDVRVLLIDKKPLSFLNVEDMRFDMINEMDYNHRLMGAEINISSGGKTLHIRSYNKPRLRKLIGHVQHCIADAKKKQTNHQDSQVSHLEQINKQLQEYLFAQQQYQLELQKSQIVADTKTSTNAPPAPPRPNHELADYLYAQSLLKQYNQENGTIPEQVDVKMLEQASANMPDEADAEIEETPLTASNNKQMNDIYSEGMMEVFGKAYSKYQRKLAGDHKKIAKGLIGNSTTDSFAVNPSRIAFSKLPTALRDRKFSQQAVAQGTTNSALNQSLAR